MNLPNQLTVARLGLTAVFVACFYTPWANAYSIALLIFSIASITDYLDGAIARAQGIVTGFGKLFDPVADKILIAAAFILLSVDRVIPSWITIAILSREILRDRHPPHRGRAGGRARGGKIGQTQDGVADHHRRLFHAPRGGE